MIHFVEDVSLSLNVWKQVLSYQDHLKVESSAYVRGTRLGKFSPNGQLFLYFGKFLKITAVAPIFATFPLSMDHVLMLAKISWAPFWAIFSKTHLVNLAYVYSYIYTYLTYYRHKHKTDNPEIRQPSGTLLPSQLQGS
jgi:hypothetical protein